MADFQRNTLGARGAATPTYDAAIDQGLRAHMVRVYNYMMLALGLSGAVAFAVSTSPALLQTIFGTPLKWVVMLAPLGVVFYLSARVHKLSFGAAQGWFWAFATLMGVSLSTIFIAYTGQDIFRVFLITGVTFGAMSLYGYTTKTDLSKFGSFLIMGLIGIIIASVVNIFMQSSALQFAVSIAGVLIFTGLTAYDTQRVKEAYFAGDDTDTAGKKALMGALSLYLDFINLFIMLLSLLGGNRE